MDTGEAEAQTEETKHHKNFDSQTRLPRSGGRQGQRLGREEEGREEASNVTTSLLFPNPREFENCLKKKTSGLEPIASASPPFPPLSTPHLHTKLVNFGRSMKAGEGRGDIRAGKLYGSGVQIAAEPPGGGAICIKKNYP